MDTVLHPPYALLTDHFLVGFICAFPREDKFSRCR